MAHIVINIEYLKSWNGIFKLLQLMFDAICIGIISELNSPTYTINTRELCFLVLASSFFIGTFIILISYLVSPFTASILPQTIYECLYNLFAFLIHLIISLEMIIQIHTAAAVFNYGALLAVSICGLLNVIAYGFSTSSAFISKWNDGIK